MTKFRLVLVLLCLGLLGAMPFVIGASKPDTTGNPRESTVQRQTTLQRQLAAARAEAEADPIQARQINEAQHLAEASKYKEALAIIDGLKGIPEKTPLASRVEDMRQQWLVKSESGPGSQAR
jgi:hypothetical protein